MFVCVLVLNKLDKFEHSSLCKMAHLAQGLGWKLPLISCNGYADCRLLVYHQPNGLTIPLQLLLARTKASTGNTPTCQKPQGVSI
jgi:hypothetical protein